MPQVAVRFNRTRRKFYKYALVKQEIVGTHEQDIKPTFLKDFRDIVSNWSNRPGFQARKVLTADAFRLYVYPTGPENVKQIWQWNVEGTRPHPITPKNAPRLRFQWGGPGSYLPKTGPGGAWYGGPGTVIGGSEVFSLGVMHPGTDPRNWPQVIAEKRKRYYSKTVENAWRRALRKIDS